MLEKEKVKLTGKVSRKIYQTDREGKKICLVYLTQITDASELQTAGYAIPEGVRVYVDREPAWGSTVIVLGKVRNYRDSSNPGEFDARLYYRTQGLDFDLTQAVIVRESISYDKPREKLWQFRAYLADLLHTYLQEDDASVVCTMLLGEKSTLDAQTRDLFKRNGVIHILTVSGLHISILGMGLYRLLRRALLPILPAALLSMGVMLAYGVMVGPGASSFRALFMFGMHLLANMCGRTYDLLTALALAAVLLLVGEPLYLYNSGYLFSFASVLAIGAVLPQFTSSKRMNMINSGIVIFLVTFPIHLWFYFEYPYISMLLNIIIIPFMSVLLKCVVFLLFCAGAVPGIGKFLASAAAVPVHLILWLYRQLCALGDQISWQSEVMGKPFFAQVILYYLILVAVWWLWEYHKEFTSGMRLAWLCIAVMILTYRYPQGFKVVFLDVGQGDGIYLATEDDRHYLFDGGSSSRSNVGKNILVPFLKCEGTEELDCVFLSHPDEDHISGVVEMLEQQNQFGIRIHSVALPDISNESKGDSYRKLEQTAAAVDCRLIYLSRGMQLQSKGLSIRCLHPSKGADINEANEYSACFLVEQENFQMLLTGDITGEGELQMWREVKPCLCPEEKFFVWKIAHHGSAYSTPRQFLEEESPDLAVISCGASNPYGHPHAELLERLDSTGTRWLCTKDCGAITIKFSRNQPQVYGYRW